MDQKLRASTIDADATQKASIADAGKLKGLTNGTSLINQILYSKQSRIW